MNFRIILAALVTGALAFSLASCGSKKKAEEGDQTTVGATDDSISSSPMQFDPQGSDSGNIAGLSSITFAYDQASLTATARKKLADNANWIRENQNVTVQIEGHCDSRGSVEYNLALGERRAKSVKTYLTSLGIDPKRLTIISYGKEKPLAYGDTESDHETNRRANFVPLPQ